MAAKVLIINENRHLKRHEVRRLIHRFLMAWVIENVSARRLHPNETLRARAAHGPNPSPYIPAKMPGVEFNTKFVQPRPLSEDQKRHRRHMLREANTVARTPSSIAPLIRYVGLELLDAS